MRKQRALYLAERELRLHVMPRKNRKHGEKESGAAQRSGLGLGTRLSKRCDDPAVAAKRGRQRQRLASQGTEPHFVRVVAMANGKVNRMGRLHCAK